MNGILWCAPALAISICLRALWWHFFRPEEDNPEYWREGDPIWRKHYKYTDPIQKASCGHLVMVKGNLLIGRYAYTRRDSGKLERHRLPSFLFPFTGTRLISRHARSRRQDRERRKRRARYEKAIENTHPKLKI